MVVVSFGRCRPYIKKVKPFKTYKTLWYIWYLLSSKWFLFKVFCIKSLGPLNKKNRDVWRVTLGSAPWRKPWFWGTQNLPPTRQAPPRWSSDSTLVNLLVEGWCVQKSLVNPPWLVGWLVGPVNSPVEEKVYPFIPLFMYIYVRFFLHFLLHPRWSAGFLNHEQ